MSEEDPESHTHPLCCLVYPSVLLFFLGLAAWNIYDLGIYSPQPEESAVKYKITVKFRDHTEQTFKGNDLEALNRTVDEACKEEIAAGDVVSREVTSNTEEVAQ